MDKDVVEIFLAISSIAHTWHAVRLDVAVADAAVPGRGAGAAGIPPLFGWSGAASTDTGP